MGDRRSNLIDETDLSEFTPRSEKAPRPHPDAAREAAKATGFKSREAPMPAAPEPARPQRRRRTGRNAQFNIKAKPEVIQEFINIADANGWVLGEALEKAVELLKIPK